MSNVWICIPSARDADSTIPAWTASGYKTCIWRPKGAAPVNADLVFTGDVYSGYAATCNMLVRVAFEHDPKCDWVVCAGDDMLPDPSHTAEDISTSCFCHFSIEQGYSPCGTYGVMQPTGDRWGDSQGAYTDRVCGSAWIGRRFWEGTYAGKGPFWPEYFHMGADEELQEVAVHLGVLWQRPDLQHYHSHWGRPKPGERMGHSANRPAFLDRANSGREWEAYKRLIAMRKANGWPGL